jgi:hypothetical protein
MLAVPSFVPVSAAASACARAFTTSPHAHPSAFSLLSVEAPPRVPEGCHHPMTTVPDVCSPIATASPRRLHQSSLRGLSLLPAWCAVRLAGGQPGGLTSSQPWHAGAAERHAPWGHGRGARRCWRVGHVKSGLFSLYSSTVWRPARCRRTRLPPAVNRPCNRSYSSG